MSKTAKKTKPDSSSASPDYSSLVKGVSELLETARRASARTVNAFMTATYWEVGRRIVEFEQGGEKRAGYGKELLERLSKDLTARLGRGFARPNLIRFRQFYHAFPTPGIRSTASNDSPALAPICSTVSNELPETSIPKATSRESGPFSLAHLARAFPLSWSHYVLLISTSRSSEAFSFYHTEALRGGWSVRQLARQMDSQFYERTALSRDKAAMLAKGAKPRFNLKLGRFNHADADQMNVYLNYAREHWTQLAENPPVGVILCSGKGEALVRYATDTLPNKMLVREYLTALPDEKVLAEELEKTRKQLETRD